MMQCSVTATDCGEPTTAYPLSLRDALCRCRCVLQIGMWIPVVRVGASIPL